MIPSIKRYEGPMAWVAALNVGRLSLDLENILCDNPTKNMVKHCDLLLVYIYICIMYWGRAQEHLTSRGLSVAPEASASSRFCDFPLVQVGACWKL